MGVVFDDDPPAGTRETLPRGVLGLSLVHQEVVGSGGGDATAGEDAHPFASITSLGNQSFFS